MNANELADDLWACFTKSDWEYVDEAVAMLRQQQAEIEVLKKFKAEIDAENKKLFEAVQKANAMWDRATGVKNGQ